MVIQYETARFKVIHGQTVWFRFTFTHDARFRVIRAAGLRAVQAARFRVVCGPTFGFRFRVIRAARFRAMQAARFRVVCYGMWPDMRV